MVHNTLASQISCLLHRSGKI